MLGIILFYLQNYGGPGGIVPYYFNLILLLIVDIELGECS